MTAPDLVIQSLKSRAVLAPMARPIRTAVGEIPKAPLVLIDVVTKDTGTGSAYIFAYSDRMLSPLLAVLKSIEDLIAEKPLAPADVMASLRNTFRLLGSQGLLGMALSGLEMALWDALGKASGVSVASLIGSNPRPIKAYDSYSLIDPKADKDALEESIGSGFQAIKIKVGDADLAKDLSVVSAVRNIIGPEPDLMIDFNQSQSSTEAQKRIERLSEFDLTWAEEPVHAEDLRGHAAVRSRSSVPIQTGENWWFVSDMIHAIDTGASDLAMLDLMKIGGISGWMKAANLAEAASLPVSSHIFVEASAHALCATPTAHYLEYFDLASSILKEPVFPDQGTITPHGPGLGMNWDEAKVAEFLI